MSNLRTSVLVPSRRPRDLVRCVQSLARQTTTPGEVLVVWQGDDTATRDAANDVACSVDIPVRVLHCPEVGVVPAENTALDRADGEVILLLDDDAVAPAEWIARHLAHYDDAQVGAVGGPFDNYHPDGRPFPRRCAEPVGKISWYGKTLGNIHDHVFAWRSRPADQVQHLAGGNMSLRRAAFGRFESRLRRYWQFFETDVCLHVRARGYRVLFDFANVVAHYPTSATFTAGREGDLAVKIFNAAYNHAFVLAKHVSGWKRVTCLGYLLGVGSVGGPGLLGCLCGMARYGNPRRELRILGETLRARVDGWRAGSRERTAWPCAAGSPYPRGA